MIRKPVSLILILFALCCAGCKQEWEKELIEGVSLYKAGKQEEALGHLEKSVLLTCSSGQIRGDRFDWNGNCLYNYLGKQLHIFQPISLTLTLPPDFDMLSFEPVSRRLTVTNGQYAEIMDEKGVHLKTAPLSEDKKKPVRGVIMIDDVIIYLKEGLLYQYRLLSDSHEPYIKGEKFPPPFSKENYKAYFQMTENHLAINVGRYGSYNLYLIDRKTRKVQMKNKKTASFKYLLGKADILYVSGSAGKWSIRQMTLSTKAERMLTQIDDLTDLELFTDTTVWENKKGVWMAPHERKIPFKLPFPWKLAGKYRDRLILNTGDTSHYCRTGALIETLQRLSVEIPSLFKK